MASPVVADSGARAQAVVDALGVDSQTADKLIDIVIRYDNELARLQRQQSEVKRRLVLARHDQPKDIDFLLDDAISTQRALAQNEEQLIKRVRKIVSAKQSAQLLVLLGATEPQRGMDPAPEPTFAEAKRPSGYDPDQLFPPGSQKRVPCDPFASMHGCR